MTLVALVLGAALAVACVLYVARPFLREPEPADDRLDEPGEFERRRLALEEERDRALAALKELEFDHRTGAVADEDYRSLVGPLRKQAAEALRAFEPRAASRKPALEALAGGRERAAGRRFAVSRQGRERRQRRGGEEMVEVPGQPMPPQHPDIPEPFPPPGEADLPEQPRIPEPYPPPGEADLPEAGVFPDPPARERPSQP